MLGEERHRPELPVSTLLQVGGMCTLVLEGAFMDFTVPPPPAPERSSKGGSSKNVFKEWQGLLFLLYTSIATAIISCNCECLIE